MLVKQKDFYNVEIIENMRFWFDAKKGNSATLYLIFFFSFSLYSYGKPLHQ